MLSFAPNSWNYHFTQALLAFRGRPGAKTEKNLPSFQSRLHNKMATTLENANPTVFQQKKEREILPEEEDEDIVDEIDEREVFDILFEAPT